MTTTYLLATARCEETGQTVKQQDLTGARYNTNQRSFAEQAADRLAENMTARTGTYWAPRVIRYTPSERRS